MAALRSWLLTNGPALVVSVNHSHAGHVREPKKHRGGDGTACFCFNVSHGAGAVVMLVSWFQGGIMHAYCAQHLAGFHAMHILALCKARNYLTNNVIFTSARPKRIHAKHCGCTLGRTHGNITNTVRNSGPCKADCTLNTGQTTFSRHKAAHLARAEALRPLDIGLCSTRISPPGGRSRPLTRNPNRVMKIERAPDERVSRQGRPNVSQMC